MFEKVDDATLGMLSEYIKPRRSEEVKDLVVRDSDGKLWLLNTVGKVDPRRSPRARFAYLLGKFIVNVTEIKLLSQEKASELINLGLRNASGNCFISRVATDYQTEEFPLKTLDKAVAGELVFSLWIRRRDAHNENRSYTSAGLPVFFDFDVAFLAENEGHELNNFFNRKNTGYAGAWRVFEISKSDLPVSNDFIRKMGRQSSEHPIESIAIFKKACYEIASKINEMNQDIVAIAQEAGLYSKEIETVVPFLENGRTNLKDGVEYMLKTVI